jgi:hypothetical protein
MKRTFILLILAIALLACGLGDLSGAGSNPRPTATLVVAQFSNPTPTIAPTSTPTPVLTPTPTERVTPTPTQTVAAESSTETIEGPSPTPSATPTLAPSTPAPEPEFPASPPAESAPAADVDFVFRWARLRTNEQNSWDGTIGLGECGSDHSIYVYVGDAQENLLDDILIGDKYGNFEVPTGVDGPGMVRILVWSATMELSVVGHQDGTRYTSQFTPPLSTLDEEIPLDWLQQAGYCESSEDCQWRVENNQLCRGHYSYDVVFQRAW